MKLDLSNKLDCNRAKQYLDKLIEKKSKAELKEFRPQRTNQQNRYFHACCAVFGDYTGYSVEEVKVIIKREFGRFMVYEKNGDKFLTSTSDLDKMQFIEFMDFFRNLASEQGCYLMTPEEFYEQQFEIEKQFGHMF